MSESAQYQTLVVKNVEVEHINTQLIAYNGTSQVVDEQEEDCKMFRATEKAHEKAAADLERWRKEELQTALDEQENQQSAFEELMA